VELYYVEEIIELITLNLDLLAEFVHKQVHDLYLMSRKIGSEHELLNVSSKLEESCPCEMRA
jgi:hypothetical protein